MRLKRKFTPEERLQILRKAEANGLEVTCKQLFHNCFRYYCGPQTVPLFLN